MNEKFEHLIERAEQLIARIESVLPQPLAAPDWSAAIAWRYRKRSSGHGTLEPVRHVAAMFLWRTTCLRYRKQSSRIFDFV